MRFASAAVANTGEQLVLVDRVLMRVLNSLRGEVKSVFDALLGVDMTRTRTCVVGFWMGRMMMSSAATIVSDMLLMMIALVPAIAAARDMRRKSPATILYGLLVLTAGDD